MDFKSLESISLYKKLLNNISDGIIIYNVSGLVLWCNKQAEDMLSMSLDSIIDKKINFLFPWITNEINDNTFVLNSTGKFSKDFKISKKILEEGPCKLTALYISISMSPEHSKTMQTINHSINHTKNMITLKNPNFNFDDIIGENKKLRDLKILARRAASANSPVLIYGETGTGKELFAQSIHNASNRSGQQFISINCAAVPETLLESLFFGTTKGAYTGSVNRPGLFEVASTGTLFLDEVNSMPLSLQSKLLRVIQDGALRRVGDTKDIFVNPRIISAINTEPFKAIENNSLLNDLFYRLGVVCINIPPLRERKDDIPILANYFIKKICNKLGKNYLKLSNDVLDFFNRCSWPGNIRQLEHIIESTIVLISDTEEEILLEHLPEYFSCVSVNKSSTSSPNNKRPLSLEDEVNKTERNKIIFSLEESNGNISEAARKLQISRQSLYHKMKKYDINVIK